MGLGYEKDHFSKETTSKTQVRFSLSEDSDEFALSNGYISIVPVKHDLTDYESINKIKSWNL